MKRLSDALWSDKTVQPKGEKMCQWEEPMLKHVVRFDCMTTVNGNRKQPCTISENNFRDLLEQKQEDIL